MAGISAMLRALPAYGQAGLVLVLLYAIETEIRFGARARSYSTGKTDRRSTFAVSLSSGVPVLGLIVAMRGNAPWLGWLPEWLRDAHSLPGVPAAAWIGVALGALGILLRLWALLTLRERYTRTLLVHAGHRVARDGPYRFVRHPGYLGSLLCLNGIALASGNAAVAAASVAATFAAYAYRIRVEDAMLVAAFGAEYERYRLEVAAVLPFAGGTR